MQYLFLEPPPGFEIIVQDLKDRGWLISAFDTNDTDFFNPANYHYNEEFHKKTYEVLLDTNIFSFIVNAVKKDKNKSVHRSALALIAFCQVANIEIDPTLAIYESIFARGGNVDEAVEDLLLFYRINNSNTASVIEYAAGDSDSLTLYNNHTGHSHTKLKEQLTKHKWITEWKSIYVIILNVVRVYNLHNNKLDRFAALMGWMVKEFRLSFVAILYALYLYSSIRVEKMLKYQSESKRSDQKSQLNNMTWDLFFINSFFKRITGNQVEHEIITATDDKVVKELLVSAISIQKCQDFDIIKAKLHPNERKMVDMIGETIKNTTARAYDSQEWSPDYREELITKAESKILNPV